jgi:hypothetical protein
LSFVGVSGVLRAGAARVKSFVGIAAVAAAPLVER